MTDSSRLEELKRRVQRDPASISFAALAEEFERLLKVLDNDQLRRIAVWKLEGHTNAEIGELTGRSVPSVERKLRLIREIWSESTADGQR